MQSFSLDGISVNIPDTWYGQLSVHSAPDPGTIAYPVGHFATFPLPSLDDAGTFGSGATALMGSTDLFVALLEYVVDEYLQPGQGLFQAEGLPSGPVAGQFAYNALQVQRLNQVGFQRFFTSAERPFCLFVVMGDVQFAAPQLKPLATLLRGLSIAPRATATAPGTTTAAGATP